MASGKQVTGGNRSRLIYKRTIRRCWALIVLSKVIDIVLKFSSLNVVAETHHFGTKCFLFLIVKLPHWESGVHIPILGCPRNIEFINRFFFPLKICALVTIGAGLRLRRGQRGQIHPGGGSARSAAGDTSGTGDKPRCWRLRQDTPYRLSE